MIFQFHQINQSYEHFKESALQKMETIIFVKNCPKNILYYYVSEMRYSSAPFYMIHIVVSTDVYNMDLDTGTHKSLID